MTSIRNQARTICRVLEITYQGGDVERLTRFSYAPFVLNSKVTVDLVFHEPELPHFRGGWVVVGHEIVGYADPGSAEWVTPTRLATSQPILNDFLNKWVDSWVCGHQESLAEQAQRDAENDLAEPPE